MPFKFSWRARTIYNTGSYCQLFVTNHQKNTETDACNPIFRVHYLQTRPEKCIFAQKSRPEKCNDYSKSRPEKCKSLSQSFHNQ